MMERISIVDVMAGGRYICTVWVPGYVKNVKRYIEHLHPSLRSRKWVTE